MSGEYPICTSFIIAKCATHLGSNLCVFFQGLPIALVFSKENTYSSESSRASRWRSTRFPLAMDLIRSVSMPVSFRKCS